MINMLGIIRRQNHYGVHQICSITTSIPQSGEMKHQRDFPYVFKNERKLCVDNISLCDESKSRKISENKLHQTSKSPHK